jgi:CRISPR-associated protein Csm4
MAVTYRVRFRLVSPLATPLHSGTLFGHLCWAWRYRWGEASLAEWLCSLPSAPFLISDGFPRDYLPRPILRAKPDVGTKSLEQLQNYKRMKKSKQIPKTEFLALRSGMSEDKITAALVRVQQQLNGQTPHEKAREGGAIRVRAAHNHINRHTGRTPETGGLFFTEEEWTFGLASYRDVYLRTELEQSRVKELFELVGRTGFGKDATWGRGLFADVEVEEDRSGLFEGRGKRQMSLSHGVLTSNMRNARYKIETHYGRAGGTYSITESPFKYPMLLLQPGATFDAGDEGPYGELMNDVHPAKSWIRQNAWHLTVSFDEEE